jgi:hypothetical protein
VRTKGAKTIAMRDRCAGAARIAINIGPQ